MRARPGRILSLSTAIALSVALVVPSGFAFGGGPAAAPTPQLSMARRAPVPSSPVERRDAPAALPEPTARPAPAAPAAQPPLVRSIVDTRLSITAQDAMPVADPLAPSVPGELVVVLDSSSVATPTELALEARGAVVERPVGDPSTLLLKTPLNVSVPVFAQLAADAPGVAWVQPNYVYGQTHVPNDPMYPSQWGLPMVGAPAAWDVARGHATLVAVVDSGVDYNHPDLVGRVDVADGHDFVNGDDDALDDNGHGTHVSGIIASTMDNSRGTAGVAPECVILPVKVLSAAGWGDSSGVAAGIMYAADRGARILNLSLAGPSDALMRAAVVYAQSKGCIVVAAAGNEGSSGGASYPAGYTDVVGVGAVDSHKARAPFSNYGTGVDVAAPGLGILSTVPGGTYESWSGTSMASPFVAGIAALVLGADPGLSASAVIARVTGADRVTALSPTLGLGAGIVNAAKALADVPAAPGSDVPGILLGSSPATGSLEAPSHRVYRVYLGKDQTLETSLTSTPGPLGFDLDLRLYGSGTSSITTGTPLRSSAGSGNPETVVYTAPATGWYYLDVNAVTGAGTYRLLWAVTGRFDDDIPGVEMPPSPVTGTLDHATDLHDVYSVELDEDELLVVELAGPLTGADMDIYLFGPGATSVAADGPLAAGNDPGTSGEWLRYRAPKAGTYYVDVNARSGAGAYTLTWSRTPGVATDNIPGLEPTSSPIEGTIGGLINTDDVYKVYLQSGQTLDLTMTTGPQPTGQSYPWLLVYPPTSTDVQTDGYFFGGDAATGVAHYSYEATTTGYHYIDVFSEDLGEPVSYALDWHATAAPNDNIPGVPAPPSPIGGPLGVATDTDDVFSIHANAGQLISASLEGTPSSPGGTVGLDLYLYPPGSHDTRTDTPLAKTEGEHYPKAIGFKAATTGTYYLQVHAFAGDGAYRVVWSVKSYATVYKPIAPSRVTHGRSFTVRGYVKPRHSSGYYLVTLFFYLKDSHGAYVYRSHVHARRFYYSSAMTAYKVTVSLPNKGIWRVRAYHSDAGHAPTYSAYDYIAVR